MIESPTRIAIRAPLAEDAAALQRLCWADRPLGLVTGLLERALTLAGSGRGAGAVATYGSVPCGFGLLTLWPAAAEISDLCVGAAYRGRGIGSALLSFLTETAHSLQVNTLEIGAALSNTRAVDLYRRHGFRDDRVIAIDLGDGPQHVVYLAKSLSPPPQRSSASSP